MTFYIIGGQGGRQAGSFGKPQHRQVVLGEADVEEGGQRGGEVQTGQTQPVPGNVQRAEEVQNDSLLLHPALRAEAGKVGVGELQGGEAGAGGQLAQGDGLEVVVTDQQALQVRQSGYSGQAGQPVVGQVQAGQLEAAGESLAGKGRDQVVAEVQPGQAGAVLEPSRGQPAQLVPGERQTVEAAQT